MAADKITFNIASTMMMCAADQMEIENFFTKALTAADSYKLEGSLLTLLEGDTAVATFEATDVRPGG